MGQAGGGIFYRQARDGLSTQYGYTQSTGFNGSLDGSQTPSAGSNLTGPYSLANPFLQGIAAPAGNTLGMQTWAGNSVDFLNPNYRIPRTCQYSVAVQRELSDQITLEVAYCPDTNFNSPTFGMLPEKQQNFPRTLQVAGKFVFWAERAVP